MIKAAVIFHAIIMLGIGGKIFGRPRVLGVDRARPFLADPNGSPAANPPATLMLEF
jgi:hypothetical protein